MGLGTAVQSQPYWTGHATLAKLEPGQNLAVMEALRNNQDYPWCRRLTGLKTRRPKERLWQSISSQQRERKGVGPWCPILMWSQVAFNSECSQKTGGVNREQNPPWAAPAAVRSGPPTNPC